MEPCIITITGASISGKSTAIKRLLSLADSEFRPVLMPKYTTRPARDNDDADVICVESLPEECDIAYQQYGVRSGISKISIDAELSKGNFPILVLNNIGAVRKVKDLFKGRVISLFNFRKVPQLKDFDRVSQERGNVTKKENRNRFEKATVIYRSYIENIELFDKTLLNVVEDDFTLLDEQLRQFVIWVKARKVQLEQGPKLFVIVGNPGSGKDEIIRAVRDLGKLDADVVPKYTTRAQEEDDGSEMICQYTPSPNAIIDCQEKAARAQLSKKGSKYNWKHYFQWDFDYDNPDHNVQFMLNDSYANGIEKCSVHYSKKQFNYGINTDAISEHIKNRHQIIVVSGYDAIIQLMKKFSNRVVVIYVHSQISEKEYLEKSLDANKRVKAVDFNEELSLYSRRFDIFNHAIIYAETKIGKGKSSQEDLIDQIFNVLRADKYN